MDNEPATNRRSYPVLYSNQARGHSSAMDFALEFQLQHPQYDGEPPVVESVARVHMSPELAKALLGLLTQLVTRYEADVGEIPIQAANEPEEDE